jgi:predicted  nucleic acid-binding Zn-ribbon protein
MAWGNVVRYRSVEELKREIDESRAELSDIQAEHNALRDEYVAMGKAVDSYDLAKISPSAMGELLKEQLSNLAKLSKRGASLDERMENVRARQERLRHEVAKSARFHQAWGPPEGR